MYPVSEIVITEDMTHDDIKKYFHNLGFVCSKKFTGEYRRKMLEIAKQRNQKVRE
ncbi:MAG: hypothetical protein HWN66_16850 [Candidatus Helarchaeota archaeon]|nr:hypothetical protein [Candidatus Helarchaeota archaeon]